MDVPVAVCDSVTEIKTFQSYILHLLPFFFLHLHQCIPNVLLSFFVFSRVKSKKKTKQKTH